MISPKPIGPEAEGASRYRLILHPSTLGCVTFVAVCGSDREDGLAPRERWAGSRSGLAVTAISVAVKVLLNLFARLLFGHAAYPHA